MKKNIGICLIIFLLPNNLTAQTQSLSDVDGNIYKTVRIGIQIWMAENLKTTKFNNNKVIPNISSNTSWTDRTAPAYCWYDNDELKYKDSYGALYNWYAANSHKLCPTGWHVPTRRDFIVLEFTLNDGDVKVGAKLKETGTTHWSSPNDIATNESGFTALPAGLRFSMGDFRYLGTFAGWWSIDESELHDSIWGIYSGNNAFYEFPAARDVGLAVRCVKDNSQIK
jgi:uncharacterized protein (TIGR02145 family)